MKKTHRFLALMLAALLCAVSGCALAEGKSWREDTSPVTLTMFVNASWWTTLFDTPVAKKITEECGVYLDILTPVADDNQKLILMINSGELPDMIVTEVGNACNQMLIESGMVWDIDELVDTYAPELRETADPAVFTDNKWTDGHTYYWTNFTDSEQYHTLQAEYNKKITSNQPCICIRRDYYEEIGSPDLSTPEAFLEAIEKIHALHPDKIGYYEGDGNLSSSSSTSMGSLGYYFGLHSYYKDAEGNIKLWPRSEQFQKWALYLRQMAQAGLFTRDSFIDDGTVAKSRILNGDLIAYGWTLYDCTMWSPADNPDTGYMVVDPWDTYRAVRTGGGWQTTFITKNANAQRCIQFINYMLDPDSYGQFGVRGEKDDPYISDAEGPHYYMDEEGWPHYTADYLAKLNSGEYSRDVSGAGPYFFFNSSALANVLYWEKEADPLYDHFNEVFGPHIEYHNEYNSQIIKPASDSDEGTILSKYQSVFNSYLVDIVFAESEEAAVAALKTMNDAMDAMGCQQLEAYYTAQVQEYLSR